MSCTEKMVALYKSQGEVKLPRIFWTRKERLKDMIKNDLPKVFDEELLHFAKDMKLSLSDLVKHGTVTKKKGYWKFPYSGKDAFVMEWQVGVLKDLIVDIKPMEAWENPSCE